MINLGILGCSEIAFRRFMPAIKNIDGFFVKIVGEQYDNSKLETFCKTYNIEGTEDFTDIIKDSDIDAIYIPQPPALHFKWAKMALEYNKHVLIEKPSTTNYKDSQELVDLAQVKELALHENYMFQYHSQIKEIKKIINNGDIGDIRLIRANFSFPRRAVNDFRYNPELGGGALLDAGGYTAKLASVFLGKSIKVDAAAINSIDGFDVDMYGAATFSNDAGQVCQVGFGMDNCYQCNLEIMGSLAKLSTNRIFTAPPDFSPVITIEDNNGQREIVLESDSHFEHSITAFRHEINDKNARNNMYDEIILQSKLIDEIKSKCKIRG
ncbi:MAG: Gfo/Idh/MocA family oxidoreductase [Lachnospiraceae bacterium]|nr:Gfo/Idh/MocA family oxidoreductase [Lachnospiraceae bacterium]